MADWGLGAEEGGLESVSFMRSDLREHYVFVVLFEKDFPLAEADSFMWISLP